MLKYTVFLSNLTLGDKSIMKQVFVLLLFIMTLQLTAQNRFIKITHPTKKKVLVLRENKNVRIKTKSGVRISGKLRIIDLETIAINGVRINLQEIEKIKRNPVGMTIATTVLLVYGGALTFAIGGIAYVLVQEPQGLWAIPIATASIYTGLKHPNFLRGFKASKNWHYEIVMH